MGYVEILLRRHLDTYRKDLSRLTWAGELKHQEDMLKTISELEYVLDLIKEDKTYQKY